ncbi:DJ-1/PfpI family protein [Mesomycoplasma lagogenitalium]|uniref:DJ-1/PfpI family protein n=1 Tax=Mesomycoplasma lagogenitalium TaxID=171286 RepID=A0ABY8LW21_9BACT|nr:DJ-1/PfpI family protein [Mesomycoplasma lagogenitalium]WGI36733.1 DJ-1/PfpI family protein [Mesomycoplasma lagogenitalium]
MSSVKSKLLVLVLDDFQDYELVAVTTTLERAKTFDEIVFFNPNESREYVGQYGIVKITTRKKIENWSNYGAIFIPGGKGVSALKNDSKSKELIERFIHEDKWVFAICDAPNVLYTQRVFDKDIIYSAYPSDYQKGKGYRKRNNITKWEKIITGKSALVSVDFALEIIQEIQGENVKNEILDALKG